MALLFFVSNTFRLQTYVLIKNRRIFQIFIEIFNLANKGRKGSINYKFKELNAYKTEQRLVGGYVHPRIKGAGVNRGSRGVQTRRGRAPRIRLRNVDDNRKCHIRHDREYKRESVQDVSGIRVNPPEVHWSLGVRALFKGGRWSGGLRAIQVSPVRPKATRKILSLVGIPRILGYLILCDKNIVGRRSCTAVHFGN